MNKAQKIREEVERLKNELIQEREKGYGSDVDDACILELQNVLTYIDSLQEGHVSKDLEEASRNYADDEEYGDDIYFAIKAAFKAGAKWQKTKDESTTEDLGEYLYELSKQFPEVSFAKLSRIGVRVAKWQKEQIMAKAIDVEVKVDAGGYPYIEKTIELYDYDKDVPLAKAGERVKVIVIKED